MTPTLERLSGFGGRDVTAGYVVRPTAVEGAAAVFASAREVTLRGAGRSYGDAATNREGLVMDLRAMNSVEVDAAARTATVGPGATMEEVWRAALPHGLWPPVVMGTARLTIGGAVAMNAHGKNAFRAGPIGEHVAAVDVLTPRGERLTLTPDDPRFRLVFGSAGLLAAVTRIVMRLRPVVSGRVDVTTRRARSWEDHFRLFHEERDAEYLVSTIDPFASGAASGRGYLQAGRFVEEAEPETLTPGPPDPTEPGLGARAMALTMNPLSMRAANLAIARTRERTVRVPLPRYSFQLDAIPGWELAYGASGFVQHHAFVPEAKAGETFAAMGDRLRSAGVPAYLAVLKKHRADAFPLSPGLDGYSLALDLPVRGDWERVLGACRGLTDLVLAAGGRFYLAKDLTLRPEDAAAYLGDGLRELRALKADWDPEGVLTSDLARRLRLFGGSPS